MSIHPTAVVSKTAQLGCGVRIGAFCVVDEDVTIGDGTTLEPYVRVPRYVIIGNRCHIHEHSVIGGVPQDMSFKGGITWTRLGDNVVCREYVTVNRATKEGGATEIKDGAFIMEGCHIAHDVSVGKNCVLANKVGLSGHVVVEDNAVIGGMTGVHQFVRIGRYSMTGGLSRIVKDVPPFCTVEGHPGRIYGLNIIGLRRNGFSSDDRAVIKKIYNQIKKSCDTIKVTFEKLKAECCDENSVSYKFVSEIADFYINSARGCSPFEKGLAPAALQDNQ